MEQLSDISADRTGKRGVNPEVSFFVRIFVGEDLGRNLKSNSQPNSTAARFNNQTAGIQRFRGNVVFILHILDMMDVWGPQICLETLPVTSFGVKFLEGRPALGPKKGLNGSDSLLGRL